MRYGVFGGTFDPPHAGHIAVAHAALEHLQLEQVVFVPAARNPLKRFRSAPPRDRLAMTKIALENEPLFAVSDIEISRGGRSFTIDTIQEFQMTRPGDIWVILGLDSLSQIMSWRSPEKLIRLCRIGVVVRPGFELSRVLSTLPEDFRDVIDPIPMREHKVSSTMIRDLVERGESPERWLNPKVWEYICESELYKEK